LSDPLYAHIRRWILCKNCRVVRVMTLTRKYSRHAPAPYTLYCCQYAQLIIYQHIVYSRITALDILKLTLLMYINQNILVSRLLQTRSLNLARLEDHITIREDNRWSPLSEVIYHV